MPTNDNNNDDKRGKIDEEEEKKVVPASFPTERDPLIWRDNNHGDDKKNHPLHGAGLPLPPRRPAAAAALPRRPMSKRVRSCRDRDFSPVIFAIGAAYGKS
jgi:hypothetical protein